MTEAGPGDNERHGHSRDDDGDRFSLTEAESAPPRRAHLAKAAAQHLPLSDITAEILRLSENDTAYLARKLKTRSKAPAPAIAQALRTFLARATEDHSSVALHDGLHYGVLSTGGTATLELDELAALLSTDREKLGFLVGLPLREALTAPEEFGVSAAVRSAIWSSMITRPHEGAVAALAWLVADPPSTWNERQTAAIAEAWISVRERFPMLPEHPVSIERLCSTVAEMERAGELEELARESVNELDDSDLADHDGLIEGDDVDLVDQLTDLSERIGEEQATYAQVRDTDLSTVLAAMNDGLVPPPGEVTRIGQLAMRMASLFAEVAATTGGPAPRTLVEAGDQVEEMAETASATYALDRVRLLAGLIAPEYVAKEADSIRELAAAVDTDTDPAVVAALDALVTAVLLGAGDPERSAVLSRIVQPTLPAAGVLVMLAGGGHLSVEVSEDVGSPAQVPVAPEPIGHERAVEPTEDRRPAAKTGTGAADTVQDTVGEFVEDVAGAGRHGTAEPSADETAANTAPDPGVATPTPDAAAAKLPATTPSASSDDVASAAAADGDLDDVLAGLDFTLPDEVPAKENAAASTYDTELTTDATVGKEASEEGLANVDSKALYAHLVRTRQFALAGWLSDVLDMHPSVSAAYRLAAHASAMRGSAGTNAAAFADEVKNLDAAALGPLPGVQMIVYAASVRAGLLSPTAGAAGPLRDITASIVKAGSAVEELTEALLVPIYSGAHLTTRSADVVAEAAGLEAEHRTLAAAARTLLDTAESRTIRYQAATELWKMWMEPKGYLGSALAIVAAGSRSDDDLRFVRRRVTELRSHSTLEKTIDDDTPKVMTLKRSRRIEARARDKIIDWTGDVADVLAQWIENVENLGHGDGDGGWMSAQITALRTHASAVRRAAVSELETIAASDDETRNAAVDAGVALLTAALDLLSGDSSVDAGPEMPADLVANGPLALADGLPIDTGPTLAPRRAVTVADIASAADAIADEAAGWTAAFNRRTEHDDQVGTQVLLEMLRTIDAGLARRLSAARDRDVAEAISALDVAVTELSARIDSDRLFGRLTYDQWSDLSIRARAYDAETRGSRRDFDVMRTTLLDVETDREAQSLAAVEAAWTRMGRRELTDEQITRVSDCIARGDLTTADEYLETIRVKGDLPAVRAEVDHLRHFFPTFPALFASTGRATSPLTELKRAIEAGENPTNGKLASALASAGIDVSAIERNVTASSRIEQWLKLAAARTLDGKAGNVKAVLEQLGYLVADTRIQPSKAGRSPGGRSAWTHLSGVRTTSGKALIPAFGTRMSPSGDTLRVLALWGAPTVSELVEQLRSEPVEHSVVLLYFGTLGINARSELAAALRGGRKLPTTIVVDEAMFAYLAAQPEPRRDITMSVALPFASAEPFTPDVAGLVPVEMFYGRTEELDQVVNMMGSCIVYGGRQLGKSALLRAAAREFDDKSSRQAVYQSIYKVGQAIPVDAVWPTLWPRLAERGIVPYDMPAADVADAAVGHITRWISAERGRQLLLLLDESDFFLDADAKDGSFAHVAAFKELMEITGRAVKVVFAGLHQTARFERLSNHPLAHLGNPVCVGPLTPQHAYDLLTRPLRALGYRFTDDNDAARVLALANNQPALIQLFGAQLLRRLQKTPPAPNTPPSEVTAADIEAVWVDEALRTEFRRRFDWTLNLDPRYKIIAYCVAFHAHSHGVESALSPTELRSQCEQWWPQGFAAKDVLTGEFRALLDECVALGVLSYNTEGAYRLRTPNVLALLGSRDEVDDVLDQAEAQQPPESFDGSLLRPAFGTGHTRSPLTSAQISDLLSPASRVRVIAGSPALTVERCARVLLDKDEHAAYGKSTIVTKATNAAGLVTACEQVSRSGRNGVALVVVDLKGAPHEVAVTAWEQAREQIAGYSAGNLGIVLLTTPAQSAMWARADRDADQSSGLTELHRYDSVGLRLWLTETTLPFQDEASRVQLLEATGGWPILVNRVVSDLLEHDRVTTTDPLEPIRGWLAQPANADSLVEACGLRADDVLNQAWSFLVTEFGRDAADPITLAELLTLAADEAPALTDNALAAAGYGSTQEVIEVLRILGVLVTSPDDGQLRLEPVVAAATVTASGDAVDEEIAGAAE